MPLGSRAVRDALRRLARDDWVLGIAAAIAIGYASVVALRAIVDVAFQAKEDVERHEQFVVAIAGRDINYRELLVTLLTLAAVATLSAWLLRRAQRNTE